MWEPTPIFSQDGAGRRCIARMPADQRNLARRMTQSCPQDDVVFTTRNMHTRARVVKTASSCGHDCVILRARLRCSAGMRAMQRRRLRHPASKAARSCEQGCVILRHSASKAASSCAILRAVLRPLLVTQLRAA